MVLLPFVQIFSIAIEWINLYSVKILIKAQNCTKKYLLKSQTPSCLHLSIARHKYKAGEVIVSTLLTKMVLLVSGTPPPIIWLS